MWKYYALLSALMASATALCAKVGLRGIDPNLATAIRTAIILVLTWGIVAFSGTLTQLRELSRGNWMFLVLSGVATGLSWLFYFKALSLGDVARVAPLDKLSVAFTIVLGVWLLHEPADLKLILGGALIVAGALIIIW